MVMNSFMAKREARGLNINLEEEKKALEEMLVRKHRKDMDNQTAIREVRKDLTCLFEYFHKEMIKYNENKLMVKKKVDFRSMISKMMVLLANWHKNLMKYLRVHERGSNENKNLIDMNRSMPKIVESISL